MFWLSTNGAVFCYFSELDWMRSTIGRTQDIYDSDDEIGRFDERYYSAIWTWLAAA